MVQRRRRAWGDTRLAGFALAANGESRSDLLVGLSGVDTKTVVRIIGGITVYVPVNNNVETEAAIDVVIGVASREAFDLGTLPDADAVADYPTQGWLYAATKIVFMTTGSVEQTRSPVTFDFDLRASRKIDRGVLYMTILNTSLQGGNSIEITGRVRALCLT